MRALREIQSEDRRILRDIRAEVSTCSSVPEVGRMLMKRTNELVRHDCFGWHEVVKDYSFMPLDMCSTDAYVPQLIRLGGYLQEVLLEHPIMAHWREHGVRFMEPGSISDHISTRRFEEHTVYKEAYRYFDTRFQMGIMLPELEDRWINLCLNRYSRDFSKRERELVHALALEINPIVDRLVRQRKERELSQLQKQIFEELTGLEGNYHLAPRELQVMPGLIQGRTYRWIADEHDISAKTVEHYASAVYGALGVENRTQLAALFAKSM